MIRENVLLCIERFVVHMSNVEMERMKWSQSIVHV